MNETLRIAILEFDVKWNDKESNLRYVKDVVYKIGDSFDIVVLPEMFAIGFTFDEQLAETDNGMILSDIKELAVHKNIAICGTFLAIENKYLYNRCFFVCPDGKYYHYDKHHLFCMSDECKFLTPGNDKCIFNYNGWNIGLFVCYDLRFPIWMRNLNNIYDVAIVPANWPTSRSYAWEHLLIARAIENQSYIVSANRTGVDFNGLKYPGLSMVLDPKGYVISEKNDSMNIIEAIIEKDILSTIRKKYQFWKDADI